MGKKESTLLHTVDEGESEGIGGVGGIGDKSKYAELEVLLERPEWGLRGHARAMYSSRQRAYL